MNIRDLLTKWGERRKDLARLGANVSADALLGDVVADLEELERDRSEETASLSEAAEYSGLHPDSISRRIRKGTMKNYGTRARPRVRLSDLSKKVARGPDISPVAPRRAAASSTGAALAKEIILDVVASHKR